MRAVGPVWQELTLAPLPYRKPWFVSAGDGIPLVKANGCRQPEPWPDEVRYKLASTKVTRKLGQPTMIATYEMA